MKNEHKRKKQLLTKIIKTLDIHFMYKHTLCINTFVIIINMLKEINSHSESADQNLVILLKHISFQFIYIVMSLLILGSF